jgi:hypothetical protein
MRLKTVTGPTEVNGAVYVSSCRLSNTEAYVSVTLLFCCKYAYLGASSSIMTSNMYAREIIMWWLI